MSILIPFIAIPLYLALLFAIRNAMAARLRGQMHAASKFAHTETLLDTETDAPNVKLLSFERLDTQTASPDAELRRKELAARARCLFRIAFVLDLSFAAAYAFGTDYLSGTRGIDSPSGFVGLIVFYLTLLRYPLYCRQFYGRRWLQDSELPPARLFLFLVSPRWQPMLRTLMLAAAALESALRLRQQQLRSAVVLAFVAALQGVGMLWFHRHIQRDRGLSLLLLRVFGNETSSRLTFGGLLERWQHIGRYFTVTDTSLLRHRTRVFTMGTFLVSCNLIWLVGVSAGLGPTIAVMLFCLAVEVWLMFRRISVKRVDSIDGLLKLLEGVEGKPRESDLTFRSLELPCYDNTWRPAVAELARRADVVLMDLRGYTPDRTGCTFEVEFLFYNVPLARILFLVDSEAAVSSMLLERWQKLSLASPNLRLPKPIAKLYVARISQVGDITRLLTELISTATEATNDERSPESLPPTVIDTADSQSAEA